MTAKYLISYPRPFKRGRQLVELADVEAAYPEVTRDTGKRIVGMRVSEGTGRYDRKRLASWRHLSGRAGERCLLGLGRPLK